MFLWKLLKRTQQNSDNIHKKGITKSSGRIILVIPFRADYDFYDC